MADDLHATDVSQHSAWIRLLYLILFAVILNITEGVTFIVAVVQFIFHLFTGSPHARLAGLGAQLAAYIGEIVSFLTYRTHRLPFPFSDWPRVGGTRAE